MKRPYWWALHLRPTAKAWLTQGQGSHPLTRRRCWWVLRLRPTARSWLTPGVAVAGITGFLVQPSFFGSAIVTSTKTCISRPISLYNELIYYWCNYRCSPYMSHLVHICPSQGEGSLICGSPSGFFFFPFSWFWSGSWSGLCKRASHNWLSVLIAVDSRSHSEEKVVFGCRSIRDVKHQFYWFKPQKWCCWLVSVPAQLTCFAIVVVCNVKFHWNNLIIKRPPKYDN